MRDFLQRDDGPTAVEYAVMSARGRRRIDLSRFALDALHEHRTRMLREGHATSPVFCDRQGGWLRKGNVLRRSFWTIIGRANDKAREEAAKRNAEPVLLPEIRFHDMRHTSATLLLLTSENAKVVSERLGHAFVQLTLDTYSHVLTTMLQAAAVRMDEIFTRKAIP
ncbi:MAG TPA: tyrosine-type recombinase/integrase [Gemmataceae bacterium]|nr:tyrosine-type recombinase/integrase [Gemmataceae bacterium]